MKLPVLFNNVGIQPIEEAIKVEVVRAKEDMKVADSMDDNEDEQKQCKARPIRSLVIARFCCGTIVK